MTRPHLSSDAWQQAAARYVEQVRPWTDAWRKRKSIRKPHPVYDFLFTYYSFTPAQLERWSPGVDVVMEDPAQAAHDIVRSQFLQHREGVSVIASDGLPEKVRTRLDWIRQLLTRTANRPGQFGCFGLHEWAMVYRGREVRHEKTLELRLSQEEIDAVVESRPLCCTHFDAFRFFAEDARPMNRFEPTYDSRQEMEQPACLHSNMDLYKWAYKSTPWIPSELVWKCFALAIDCREIDMRASAYDLSPFGYEAIPVETTSGRRAYEQAQRELAARAAILRQELIAALDAIIAPDTTAPRPTPQPARN
ncbi:3-methyladenine DNA glycosylase [Sulfuriroseicoccus oceanibius]|uniref:Uncharacterized protein n=1 Tax=Sulfuriroseicoccus oceanibius TaxID=2707525 RepID=A0A6B3LBP5_9BACT|nr:3-methyladenine DNA glycosylase [Sulfuriroseicoccus oceanibius]QQL46240.1 hypothetical protein G3M56_006585 [Sulfuriroseicoccus oceanibius]